MHESTAVALVHRHFYPGSFFQSTSRPMPVRMIDVVPSAGPSVVLKVFLDPVLARSASLLVIALTKCRGRTEYSSAVLG